VVTSLRGIAKHGWRRRIELMNQALIAKRQRKQLEQEAEAVRVAAVQERKALERDMVMEQTHQRTLRELEVRLQRQRSGQPRERAMAMEKAHKQALRELEARLARQRP